MHGLFQITKKPTTSILREKGKKKKKKKKKKNGQVIAIYTRKFDLVENS
jgi:hypothetical protein